MWKWNNMKFVCPREVIEMRQGELKVLCVLGSPKKNGNTAKVLSWVEEEFRVRGHSVEHIHLDSLHLEGCSGCHLCQRDPDELVCSRPDKGIEVFRKMVDADAVVYATPLYCWDFTAQMKPFIDRHLCLSAGNSDPATHRSHVEGKRVALLVTAADHEGEGNTDLISEIFRRFSAYNKTEVAAELIVPFCTTPAALGEKQKARAREFAQAVTG
jgi:multimeric flavodoxin WrbA